MFLASLIHFVLSRPPYWPAAELSRAFDEHGEAMTVMERVPSERYSRAE
jgi:hypothetical protein